MRTPNSTSFFGHQPLSTRSIALRCSTIAIAASIALTQLVGCGGKVVINGEDARGTGGAGGISGSDVKRTDGCGGYVLDRTPRNTSCAGACSTVIPSPVPPLASPAEANAKIGGAWIFCGRSAATSTSAGLEFVPDSPTGGEWYSLGFTKTGIFTSECPVGRYELLEESNLTRIRIDTNHAPSPVTDVAFAACPTNQLFLSLLSPPKFETLVPFVTQ